MLLCNCLGQGSPAPPPVNFPYLFPLLLVFAWCSNTLPTAALTAGGSWASFPPSPATFRVFYSKDLQTAAGLAKGARTGTFKPFFFFFFPKHRWWNGIKYCALLQLQWERQFPCLFYPSVPNWQPPTSPLALPPSGCVVSPAPWEQLPHTLMCTQYLYLYIIYKFK